MNDHLCQTIEKAFIGVKLGNGIGLKQASGIDDYMPHAVCFRYRQSDEKNDWRNISSKDLHECYSSLSFFDAEGMRFHLPAYMLQDLRDSDNNFSLLDLFTDLTDQSKKQFSLLNQEQRNAVRAYILYEAERESEYHPFKNNNLSKALNEYWIEEPKNKVNADT